MAVSPGGSGTTTPAVGPHDYTEGTVVDITTAPAAGYRFVNWMGDVANPSNASTTVTMNGNKTVTANFELISSTLTITNPNGGENWQVGSSQNITWTSSGTSGTVNIDYSTNNGSVWTAVIASTPDDGTHPWTIPNTPSTTCLVRVSDTDGSPTDQSNSVFTISLVPFITVSSPNGGENWQVGSSHNITWTSSGTSGNVKIEYSTNNGSSWTDVIASTPDDGSHPWTIPNAPSTTCLVRVSDTDESPTDQSNAVFTISTISQTTTLYLCQNTKVLSTNVETGGTSYQDAFSSGYRVWTGTDVLSGDISGTSYTFHVNAASYGSTSFRADLKINGSTVATTSFTVPSTTFLPYGGTVTGSDPALSGNSTVTLEIHHTGGSMGVILWGDFGTDDSYIFLPGPASIPSTLTITSPNEGENWQVGSSHDITWTATGTSGNVRIEYSTNNGSSWTDVIASTPDDGSHPWTIPNAPSTTCLVRVLDTDGSPTDQSNAVFTISPVPFITVGSPNGGENWQVVSIHDITWTSSGTSGTVRIEYSTNNGSSWADVIASTPDDETHPWTVPNTPSTASLVRISDAADGDPSDVSNSPFTIFFQLTTTVTYAFTQPGWYMVSLPVIPSDSSVASLFPAALGGMAFIWNPVNSEYSVVYKMAPKKGYWLALPLATTCQVTGTPLYGYTEPFAVQGWYMIGSIWGGANFAAPNDDPDGAVLSPAFFWNTAANSYDPSSTLEEKTGYWIAAFQACNLTLGAGGGGLGKAPAKADWSSFEKAHGSKPPAPPKVEQAGKGAEPPKEYGLLQNYPNPFNPETTIEYQLPEAGSMTLIVYDMMGREIRRLVDGEKQPGSYREVWDGRDGKGRRLNSGLYFMELKTAKFRSMKKLVITK